MDDTLTKHDKILEGLTTRSRKLNEAEVGIKGTLELILERLNAIEIRSTPVPNLNCDETGCSVCNITCECNICSGIDATSLYCSVYCVRSIDCECTICIENDAPSSGRAGFCLCSIDCECDLCIGSNTSLGSEGLKNDEREIIRPPDFHSLDDPQVELDLHILRCTRGLDLPRVCFNTLLQSVEIKKTRVASYLFDKMSVKNHVQIVHVFIGSKSKFSLVLVGKGLVVPMTDPGIRLKTPKKVGHKNNVWEILMDLTRMFCLHRSYDNINQVWDTGWQCFMHSPAVHMNSICLVTTISTYGHFSSGIGGLSLHVTASNKDIMLLWDSILQSTLHDNSKKVASIHYGSVDECEIRKAFPRRGSVMTRSLSTVRAKASLEELHDCKLHDPGISFMKKYCCLSDSRSNFDISTPGSPKYTKGVLISAYIAFSLSHWAAFERFREQLCLLNLAKALGFHWLCLEVLSSKSNSTSLKQRLESFRQNNGVAD